MTEERLDELELAIWQYLSKPMNECIYDNWLLLLMLKEDVKTEIEMFIRNRLYMMDVEATKEDIEELTNRVYAEVID